MSQVGATYVPVLKNKRGERAALRAVTAAVRSRMLPLLEFVEWTPSEREHWQAYVEKSFRGLAATTSQYARCWLDTRELSPHGEAASADIFQRAAAEGIAFVPVTGVSRTVDVRPALNYRSGGLALRLTRAELEAGGLGRRIAAFLVQHSITPEGVDLIIDLGSVNDLVVPGVQSLLGVRAKPLTRLAHFEPASFQLVGELSRVARERAA